MGEGAEERLCAYGATLNPPITIIRQPAQSPDCNICDLSFFRALAALVAKNRRGLELSKQQFDIERLCDDVRRSYDEYSVETIERMWAYKSVVMQKIIDAEGGNYYDRRKRSLGE